MPRTSWFPGPLPQDSPGSRGHDAGRRRWWALAVITVSNMLVFASVTIMNVALPQARADLSLNDGGTQAVVTVYSLTFGTFILLGGRVAALLGLRRCLVAGLAGFAAASLLGGLAPDPAVLLVARAMQGGSGAFVAATAIPLMSVIFPTGRERRIAFGVLGVVMGIGTAGSFLLGGALVDLLSWRWCLLVNVPVALLLIAGVVTTTPQRRGDAHTGVDIRGAVLISVSLGALVLGLDRATVWGWSHPGTLALLAGGVLGVGVFALSLRRTALPLIPPHLMGHRGRVAGYLAAFFVGMAMFAGMFVLTSFMQEAWAASPLRIGLAFLPLALGAVIATALLPSLRARFAPVPILATGLLITAVAIATFTLLDPGSTYGVGILPAMLLLGSGGTVVMITAGDVATEGAGDDSGIAGSMVNSAQQIGASLGTALLTSVMSGAAKDSLTSDAEPIAATVAGYGRAGGVGATVVAVAAIALLFVHARRGVRTGPSTHAPGSLRGHPSNRRDGHVPDESDTMTRCHTDG